MLADTEPDINNDEGAYGYCRRCDHEVPVVKRDMGIGRYEYQGCRGVHIDLVNCCGECGDEL